MSVFHASTTELIRHLSRQTPQSLLLTGQSGVGLMDIARRIATSGVIRHEVEPDASKATPIISVEMIRELHNNSRSKSQGKQFIIIHNADTMSPGAQASFLKLLEEPSASIYFILTSHHYDNLKDTIRSRVQRHTIQPITTAQSELLLDQHSIFSAKKRQQLLFIADGLPEELEHLITDDEYFTRRTELMVDARDFLQATTYQKLLIAQKYKDDRSASISLIETCIRILRKSLSDHPNPSFIAKLDQLISVQERLRANGNIRLQLSAFVV